MSWFLQKMCKCAGGAFRIKTNDTTKLHLRLAAFKKYGWVEEGGFAPKKPSIRTCESDDSVNLLQSRKSERHSLAIWRITLILRLFPRPLHLSERLDMNTLIVQPVNQHSSSYTTKLDNIFICFSSLFKIPKAWKRGGFR